MINIDGEFPTQLFIWVGFDCPLKVFKHNVSTLSFFVEEGKLKEIII